MDSSHTQNEKADSPRIESLDPDPNVTDKRNLHEQKHPAEIDSTFA
jgi:hypothetical protein